mmetsp:Transcript_22395/g.56594  ORF Transcript_22395/g.56594 Transcript_22395/m.56594 type:complete len:784 (+) Transcript_22395:118-2469(+)|eukprot:CAMPEP_0178991538 /NCGR_PEP_ID=MMETSP0795-20121207/5587_1 /TAXON_ID=88552 /ORGANISM="Amoebophrya sp., Strain Ameob2" /LENGTH=783 /DNA_ID=CAMNT_0020683265 /DNA_START=106 /DNA_END=2457 /DNA_ORIENTATION=-
MVFSVYALGVDATSRLDSAANFFHPYSYDWFREQNSSVILFSTRNETVQTAFATSCATGQCVKDEQYGKADGMELEALLGLESDIWWKMGVDFIPPLHVDVSSLPSLPADMVTRTEAAEPESSAIDRSSSSGDKNENATLPATSLAPTGKENVTSPPSMAASPSSTGGHKSGRIPTFTTKRIRPTGWAALRRSFASVFSFKNLKHLWRIPWQQPEESFAKIIYQASLPNTPRTDRNRPHDAVTTTSDPRRMGRMNTDAGAGAETSTSRNSLFMDPPRMLSSTSSSASSSSKNSRYSTALQHELEQYEKEEKLASNKPRTASSLSELVRYAAARDRSVRIQRLERFGGTMRNLHTDFSRLFAEADEHIDSGEEEREPVLDVGVNLYYASRAEPGTSAAAPSSERTLAPHADDMDEFVIHLHGRKRWTFPGTNETVVLQAGDAMFVGKNTWHHTDLVPGYSSAHLAIGVRREERGGEIEVEHPSGSVARQLPTERQRAEARRPLAATASTGNVGRKSAPPLYLGAPPEQKSFLEILQEEHWTLTSLFLAYAVQALMLIGLWLTCVGYWVKIDPDHGGRGSTVRSRRVLKKRMTWKGSAGGVFGSSEEEEKDSNSTEGGADEAASRGEGAQDKAGDSAGDEEQEGGACPDDANRGHGGEFELHAGEDGFRKGCASSSRATSVAANDCTASAAQLQQAETLAAYRDRMQSLTNSMLADMESNQCRSRGSQSSSKSELAKQYYELESTLAEAEAQEQRMNELRRRAHELGTTSGGRAGTDSEFELDDD